MCKQVTVCPGHFWTTLYLESFDVVLEKEVLQWVKEERNVLYTVKNAGRLIRLVTYFLATAFWNVFEEKSEGRV
jgi:hypothetical protein